MIKNNALGKIMNHNNIEESIENRIDELNRIINLVSDDVYANVTGNLRVKRKGKGYQYFHITKKGDTTGEYICAKNHSIAAMLATNQYAESVRKIAKNELQLLVDFREKYKSKSKKIRNLYDNMHPGRKVLIEPYDLSDEEYMQVWQSIEYRKKPVDLIKYDYQTIKGEQVRSKSEVIIADTLYSMGIAYHYEMPLFLTGCGWIHPDFTILNKRTRKTYYLEHLGMMDDRGYLLDALSRIDSYTKNNMFLGESVLITYETERKQLNRSMLSSMIKHFLT